MVPVSQIAYRQRLSGLLKHYGRKPAKDLGHVQEILKSAVQKCKKRKKADCCHFIEALRG